MMLIYFSPNFTRSQFGLSQCGLRKLRNIAFFLVFVLSLGSAFGTHKYKFDKELDRNQYCGLARTLALKLPKTVYKGKEGF